MEKIQEVLNLTSDFRSRPRLRQLLEICEDAQQLSLWERALASTTKRLAMPVTADLPAIEKPGAYFCSTLCTIMRAAGLNPPQGTYKERLAAARILGEAKKLWDKEDPS